MSSIDDVYSKAEARLKSERDKAIESIKEALNKARENALRS